MNVNYLIKNESRFIRIIKLTIWQNNKIEKDLNKTMDLSSLSPEQIKALTSNCPDILKLIQQNVLQENINKIERVLRDIDRHAYSTTGLANYNLKINNRTFAAQNYYELNDLLEQVDQYLIIIVPKHKSNDATNNANVQYFRNEMLDKSFEIWYEIFSLEIPKQSYENYSAVPPVALPKPIVHDNLIVMNEIQYNYYKMTQLLN